MYTEKVGHLHTRYLAMCCCLSWQASCRGVNWSSSFASISQPSVNSSNYNIVMLYVKQLQKHNVICHTKQIQYHNGICHTKQIQYHYGICHTKQIQHHKGICLTNKYNIIMVYVIQQQVCYHNLIWYTTTTTTLTWASIKLIMSYINNY